MAVNHNSGTLITESRKQKRAEKHGSLAGQEFPNDTYKPLISRSNLAMKRR